MPSLLLVATRGAPPTEELPTVWRKYMSQLVEVQYLPTDHHMQEEAPDGVYDRFVKFFTT
jgi:hypothetical protein